MLKNDDWPKQMLHGGLSLTEYSESRAKHFFLVTRNTGLRQFAQQLTFPSVMFIKLAGMDKNSTGDAHVGAEHADNQSEPHQRLVNL